MKEETKKLADAVGAVYPILFLGRHDGVVFTETELETFVALVAERKREACLDVMSKAAEKGIDTAMALEREACAKLVDHILKDGGGTYGDAIRARGQA